MKENQNLKKMGEKNYSSDTVFATRGIHLFYCVELKTMLIKICHDY